MIHRRNQHSWKASVQTREYTKNVSTNANKKQRNVPIRVSMPRGHDSSVIAIAHFTKFPAMEDVPLTMISLGSYHARLTR